MSRARALVAVVCVLTVLPGTADAAAKVKLNVAPKKAKAASLVTFKGRAGSNRGARVTVERRQGAKWKTIAAGRTGKRGAFALTWIAPGKRGRVAVRARLGGKKSPVKRLRIKARAKGTKHLKVSKKTRIISPSVVKSVPKAGKKGSITYAGGNDIKKGAIVAIGQGAQTPNGFLGKVKSVKRKGGQTIATTVPATLEDAIPNGSIDLVAKAVSAHARSARAQISCEGSAGVEFTPDVSFSSDLNLSADWSLLKGLQSASLTARASFDASLEAAATAAGSCTLTPNKLLTVKGPSFSGFVGPVPIVMTSDLTVYLDATAEVQGSVSTSASAGFTASAGAQWTKAGGFSGTQSFTPHFGFEPPQLSASASVAANLTPTVDVLFYGVAGPRIALRTGVEFAADPSLDPWWTLSVPVDLTASLAIPALDLESPQLEIYSHEFVVADAGGPFGSEPPPTSVTNAASPGTSIAAGYDQSCALKPDATVKCWGGNSSGQLGDGTTTQRPTPVAVKGITDAAAIAAGSGHTCALRVHGQVMCWGKDDKGQLGNGATANSATPVAAKGITLATAITTSANNTCALIVTRRIDCWGESFGGATPTEVDGITDANAIAVSTAFACAVRAKGTVACWGSGGGGELGNGASASSATPVTVSGISDAIGISVGANHGCALRSGGTVACWGNGFYGQLGNGSKADSNTPVAVNGVTGAIAIRSGGAHTCAVLASGGLQCWGWNNYGQLGDGSTTDRPAPVSVSGITNATAVTGGLEHSCALLQTGGVSCWGYGGDGELGYGGIANSATPKPVAALR